MCRMPKKAISWAFSLSHVINIISMGSLFQKISVEIIQDFYLSQNGNHALESLDHCFKVENYSNVFFKGIM